MPEIHFGQNDTTNDNLTRFSVKQTVFLKFLGEILGKHGKQKRHNQMDINQLYRVFGGEKGIRTLGTHSVQRFSRPPHSTTLASLPNLFIK